MDSFDQYVAMAETVITRSVLETATPDLYRQNAFRVLQLPLHATMHDVTRREKMLAMAQKLGMQSENGRDELLPLSPTPDADAIREAKHRLADPPRRIIEEIFWFWPTENNGDTDQGLLFLRQKRVSEALEQWLKDEKDSVSIVPAHNLAVLYHVLALDAEQVETDNSSLNKHLKAAEVCWRRAYCRWRILLEEPRFWDHVAARMDSLADPRLTAEAIEELRRELPRALLAISGRLILRCADRAWHLHPDNPLNEYVERATLHRALMGESGFNEATVDRTLRRIAAPARERIKATCEQIEATARGNPERFADSAQALLDRTRRARRKLDLLLQVGHPSHDAALDEVTELGRKLTVSYFHQTEDWQTCLGLLEQLSSLAVNRAAREVIEDDLSDVRYVRDAGVCFYCGEGNAKASDAVEFSMHLVTDRRQTSSGIELEYERNSVSVPRCKFCRHYHIGLRQIEQGEWETTIIGFMIQAFGGVSLVLTSIVVFFLIFFLLSIVGGVAGSVFFGVVSLVLIPMLYNYWKLNAGTPFRIVGNWWNKRTLQGEVGERQSCGYGKGHPRIQALLEKGWKFGDEPKN